MKPRHKSFDAWFDAKLGKDHARDIAEHGADAGFPYITYTSDCVRVFDAYADEIWNRVVDAADDYGQKPCELVANFGRSDLTSDWDGLRTLLLWFACEERARELRDPE